MGNGRSEMLFMFIVAGLMGPDRALERLEFHSFPRFAGGLAVCRFRPAAPAGAAAAFHRTSRHSQSSRLVPAC